MTFTVGRRMKFSDGFVNCCGGINSDCPTEMGKSDVDRMLEVMYKGLAEEPGIFSSDGIFCLVHPCVAIGLYEIPKFIHIKDYPFPKVAVKMELGSINGVRFILSKGMETQDKSARGNKIYNSLLVGATPNDYMFSDGFLVLSKCKIGADKVTFKATTYYD